MIINLYLGSVSKQKREEAKLQTAVPVDNEEDGGVQECLSSGVYGATGGGGQAES